MKQYRNIGFAALVLLLVALMVGGIFYGILAEQNLRDLKYSDGWWKWQHERALAEHYAAKEWTR